MGVAVKTVHVLFRSMVFEILTNPDGGLFEKRELHQSFKEKRMRYSKSEIKGFPLVFPHWLHIVRVYTVSVPLSLKQFFSQNLSSKRPFEKNLSSKCNFWS